MATEAQPQNTRKGDSSSRTAALMHFVQNDTRPIQSFINKFNNDWTMNFAGIIAYNLMMSILPIAVALLAIFGGSRLFVSLEGILDILYRVRPRPVIRQNLVAILMLLLFIVLIPIMV